MHNTKVSLAIFASGGGSNALKIMQYFQDHSHINVALVLYNRKDAGVKNLVQAFNVPAIYWNNQSLSDKELTLSMLTHYNVNGIILAGFLQLIPSYLIEAFEDKILNIHPSLLPSFGGKGMYGMHVHEAVSSAGVYKTGMTIHLVNQKYDEGKILFQQSVSITPHEDPHVIAKKVLVEEHLHYSKVIESYFMR